MREGFVWRKDVGRQALHAGILPRGFVGAHIIRFNVERGMSEWILIESAKFDEIIIDKSPVERRVKANKDGAVRPPPFPLANARIAPSRRVVLSRDAAVRTRRGRMFALPRPCSCHSTARLDVKILRRVTDDTCAGAQQVVLRPEWDPKFQCQPR